mgnify:CR=1 FL=1
MDVLSLIGVILAFVAILGGNYLEGGHAAALLNGPAALIVIGGTLGAAFLQAPMNVFKRALAIIGWIFFSAACGPGRGHQPGGWLEYDRAQGRPAWP